MNIIMICAFLPIDDIKIEYLVSYGINHKMSYENISKLLKDLVIGGILEKYSNTSFRMHREV